MNIRARIFGGKTEEPDAILPAKKPKGVQADALHSIPVSRGETRRANTRGDDRHRLTGEQARVLYDGQHHQVELINVSGGGAMVTGPFEPKLWDRVDLAFGEGGAIECVVCWLKGSRIGLEFAQETRLECSPDEQAVLLREVIARSFPDAAFELNGEAPAERQVADENRGNRRHPLIWSAVVHHDYQSTPVRLRNISSTGALIDGNAYLRPGAEPLLDLGEAGTVFATVAWAVGDQAGLTFHTPFDLSLLARAKPDVAPTQWDAPTYLGSGASEDSAEHWGRMSLGELREELEGYMKR